MVSHHPESKTYRSATGEEYSAFFQRIESFFEPSQMSSNRLSEFLGYEGGIVDQFALTKEFYSEIGKATTIEQLKIVKHHLKLCYEKLGS